MNPYYVIDGIDRQMSAFLTAKILAKEGNSPVDCLRHLLSKGYEFPDAKWAVIHGLKLSRKAIKQMVSDYDGSY